MFKLIAALVLSVVACLLVDQGVSLWETHTGFLWGLLAVFVFNLSFGVLQASVRLQWREWVVESRSRNILMRCLNVFIALVLLYCGYYVLVIGWGYWWTGICVSIFIGLGALMIGVYAIAASLALMVASFFTPTWMRKLARTVDSDDHMMTAEEFFKD